MDTVNILKALADPTRLKILDCIKNGEKCICEIIPYTNKSQPNVSQHLKILNQAGLIEQKKDGTRIMVKVSRKDIYNIIDSINKLQQH